MAVPGDDKGVPWVHQGDWGSDDHCQVKGEVVSYLPIPRGTEAACDIKIEGACGEYPAMSDRDWFRDADFGGPPPSSDQACQRRRESWQASCGTATVSHRFRAASSYSCYVEITGACDDYPAMSDAGWFVDAEHGGPPAWTAASCDSRAESWKQSCGHAVIQHRFMEGWTSASDGGRSAANQANNNPMAVLLSDNRTIVQMQPAYRCDAHGPFLARFGNDTDGCPQKFPNTTDILGDGALGAHGGSGLSGIGGSIRLGELLPESGPIGHALKLELQHQWYYGGSPLSPGSSFNGNRRQFVWPATGSDSGSQKAPGGLYTGTNPHLAPGALLAIPGDIAGSVKVSTPVGAKIKQALIDYGAYLVDDTGGGNSAAICMQAEVNEELRRVYGYTMTYPHGVTSSLLDSGRDLYHDLLQCFQALHAVANNGPDSIGGGGQPRQPRKPPICDTAEALV